jgi:two-component system LytT family response regulator
MKIRTLIIDDELLARKLIRRLLAAEAEIEIVGECADGREAVAMITRTAPDLIFLDVQMPEWGGFEVLQQLKSTPMPVIVFVTAYDKFALDAFAAHALDYLLKPLDEERFLQMLERVKIHLNGRRNGVMENRLHDLIGELAPSAKTISRLAIKSSGRVVFLNVKEIDWVEASGNYLDLHAGKECHVLRGRLSELEKRLNSEQFFRIHRSTIVNLDRVKEFQPLFKGECVVVMKDGLRLAASRSYSHKLQELFEARL